MLSRLGIVYALFYGGQFILLGVQLPFLAGWFATSGFSTVEIGSITGLALIARLLLAPFVALWADHQTDARLPLRIISGLFALGATTMAIFPSKAIIAGGAVLVLWSFGVLTPLTDTAVLRADKQGRLHYGRMRAVGSTFFLVTNVIAGYVVASAGVGVVVPVMAAAACLAFLASLALPPSEKFGPTQRLHAWRDAPQLIRNRFFLLAIVAAGLTQGAHAVYYAFSYNHWTALGISDSSIGWFWATGVIAEIFILTRARAFMRQLHPADLLMLGAGAAVIRWAIVAIAPPLWVLFATQLLHAFTFAAAYLGALEFVMRAVPARLVNTGMTLMSATGIGALTGLATFASGYVWQIAGPTSAYLMMSAMGVGALVASFILRQTWDTKRIFE